jgi:hypothetical protein
MLRKVIPLIVLVLILSLACNRSVGNTPLPSAVPAVTDVTSATGEALATIPPTATAIPLAMASPSATFTVAAPTVTPPPAPTPTEQPCLLDMEAVDVTIMDGTQINVNTPFLKTWRVTNSGTCNWTADYKLVFTNGDKMGGLSPVKFGVPVGPGKQLDVSVDLVAPGEVGPHIGYWQVQQPDGNPVGLLWVEIQSIQPPAQQPPANEPPPQAVIPDWPTLRKGDSGIEVTTLQYLLSHYGYPVTSDGVFGYKTADAVAKFQSDKGLTADSIVGGKTWAKLIEGVTLKKGSSGEAVKGLQTLLKTKFGKSLTIDGVFGSATANAVVEFQQSYNLEADGIVGAKTWQSMIGD